MSGPAALISLCNIYMSWPSPTHVTSADLAIAGRFKGVDDTGQLALGAGSVPRPMAQGQFWYIFGVSEHPRYGVVGNF